MNNYSNKFSNSEEVNNNELVFIDLEANQDVNNANLDSGNNHYLLELSGIKSSDGEIISKFNTKVFQRTPLNKQVASLLNKPQNYYSNTEFPEEDETYSDFMEFCKGSTIITYGDYDQIVLNAVAKRYKLAKVQLVDICEIIKKKLNIKKDFSPSLSAIAYAFGINQEQYQKHEAAGDAQLLFDIYLEYLYWDKNKLFFLRENIMNELIRPTKYKEYIKKNNKFDIDIEKDYFYIFDNSEIREKHEKDNNNKIISTHYTYHLDIRVFNRDAELIKDFNKEWTTTLNKNEAKQLIQDARAKIARDYATKSVFISLNKIKTAYSDILINIFNNQIPLIYTVSPKVLNYVLEFSFSNLDDIKKVINKLNQFYNEKKKDFSTIIDYSSVFNL